MKNLAVFGRAIALALCALALVAAGQVRMASAEEGVFTVAPVYDFTQCDEVGVELDWSNLPAGGWFRYELYSPEGHVDSFETIYNFGGDEAGASSFALEYTSGHEGYEFWALHLVYYLPQFDMEFDQLLGFFDRPCATGSVGPGGTGNGGDPVDPRADETSDSGDVTPAEDPDDDGRVQVP